MPTTRPAPNDPRRGATLVLIAISMIALLAMIALAVDLGMAFTARSEAQRVADAAALAGGSAFLDLPADEAEDTARARAYEYALRNVVRNVQVDSSEVTVQVLPDERKVRVWVRRAGLGTWFARVLGINSVDVAAKAAAQASEAGEGNCLKPFAVPDMWQDNDNDDGNRIWDPGENWEWNPAVDRYQKYDPDKSDLENQNATSYGSEFRDTYGNPAYVADYGRPIQLKAADPNDTYVPAPGVFLPWRIPEDPDMPECTKGGGGSEQGGAVYRRNICSCNASDVELGTEYEIEPGNMIGPTAQGIGELIDADPNAAWDPTANDGRGGVVNWDQQQYGPNWMDSPRVVKIALFPPGEIDGSGMQTIKFNDFALMFIERQDSPQDPVVGRFIPQATGSGSGPTTGTLVLFLRLVE